MFPTAPSRSCVRFAEVHLLLCLHRNAAEVIKGGIFRYFAAAKARTQDLGIETLAMFVQVKKQELVLD
jgi:hypothetical protein